MAALQALASGARPLCRTSARNSIALRGGSVPQMHRCCAPEGVKRQASPSIPAKGFRRQPFPLHLSNEHHRGVRLLVFHTCTDGRTASVREWSLALLLQPSKEPHCLARLLGLHTCADGCCMRLSLTPGLLQHLNNCCTSTRNPRPREAAFTSHALMTAPYAMKTGARPFSSISAIALAPCEVLTFSHALMAALTCKCYMRASCCISARSSSANAAIWPFHSQALRLCCM